ncbi:DUF155-domain-containing protein [Violaceomyces palustris]|uniref:DUF155-domain-containing protein n=1 Tax=Violaceomyces palustris TaxID=1673888 RepID=A0ACD0NMU2_9BASI|nr:DUF155-domain-containing protein [Violaceomyces palustris]
MSFSRQSSSTSSNRNPRAGGETSGSLPYYNPAPSQQKLRAGPNRSSKSSSKLKILPEEPEEGGSGGNTPAVPASPSSGSAAVLGTHQASPNYPFISHHSHHDVPPSQASLEEDSSSENEEAEDEEQVEVYKQLSQIPEGSMRRDARRLTKRARARLPRVTAYSTATSYRMRELTKWLQARRSSHGTNVMTFDECLYTTYTYEHVDAARGIVPAVGSNHQHHYSGKDPGRHDQSACNGGRDGSQHLGAKTGDLLGIPELSQEGENEEGAADRMSKAALGSEEERELRREEAKRRRRSRFAVEGITPELFIMDYGAIVIWGMTLAEEKRLLRELRRFEVERLASEDVESEDLHWYLADYSRIYNDVITLRRGSSYMTKLSLSHALAQSTKISFFEGIIDNTIEATKDIPQSIAESGKIGMPPAEIMKQIGHLFILRMNIHLVGSIVDSPEIFWTQPDLEPLYSAARSYLEIPQRIDLLNTRVEVLQDMLQLLKDQVTSSHSEYLEIVVILLIMLEIVLGVATMLVDLYFG